MTDKRAIGVFDSGVGGLTVYRALRAALPQEDFVYLGDTARLPYGTKSGETIKHYAAQAAARLREEDVKLLLVACNTASAQALPDLRERHPDIPCLGVVEPGARAAAGSSATGRIVVLATEGTVRSGAYRDAIHRLRPDAQVRGLACNLLVALAEEGWCEGLEAEAIVSRYVRQLGDDPFDTLVLGCTHFPLLAATLRRLLPSSVAVIDSAQTTARAVTAYLAEHDLEQSEKGRSGRNLFLVTDAPERFLLLAQRFLPEIDVNGVELVALRNA